MKSLIRVFIITYAIFGLNTCASSQKYTDDEFFYYQITFQKYLKKYRQTTHWVSIKLDYLDHESKLGICLMYKNPNHNHIKISRIHWDNLNKFEKEALVFHELTHCTLERLHTDDLYKGIPISVMHTTALNSFYWKKCRKEYIHEMFTWDNTLIKKCIDKKILGK